MPKPVTPQEMFDLWQKMVNPGAYPLQSLMFPMPDAKEIEKKIAELEVVEHWLKANVNMVQLTTRTLQYQLAMLKGGEKAQAVFAAGRGAAGEKAKNQDAKKDAVGEEAINPAMWAWNMMAEAAKGSPAKPAAPKKTRKS